jgi:hypothetical protein
LLAMLVTHSLRLICVVKNNNNKIYRLLRSACAY